MTAAIVDGLIVLGIIVAVLIGGLVWLKYFYKG